MNRTLTLARRQALFVTPIAAALLVGCAGSHGRARPSTAPTTAAEVGHKHLGTYRTVGEIESMPSRTATFVTRLSEYSGSFKDGDGNEFILGDDRGEQWVWHFVNALKVGTAYRLPDTLTAYMSAPSYASEQQIAAIPACTATLAARSPCSSTFRTPDGRWFGIGDPGSGPLVSQFIWSLEDGATRKFPDAFLEYQRQQVSK